ncbi:oxidoreductase domain protein [Cellulophaga algicola DSM 14237]|uniref:Oxidoreductase domain protein n=2 Tax=Cellulophaga TaxID=104264 RepID=E6X8X1_CELAD|nr:MULTISPECIES: Gfo/Idh/MocA family oxidoreductase [Cellulophaga]ADV49742.1 oxidoreductase domain protein [Cellulophaga algicola DSM 14237]
MEDQKLKNKKVLDQNISRRGFITKTALAAGAISILPRHVFGRGFIAPSDKMNLGFIGLGKQSQGLAKNFIGNTTAQVVAASDVWSTKNQWFKGHVEKLYAEKRNVSAYNGISTYLNYKELLERSDIDGVVIATPDHWHAIQAIDAMKSGKDVYCEKPLTHTIEEGIALVKTTKKTGQILQTGSMQRSWDSFRKACELIRNGHLGDIQKVLVNVGDPAVPYNLKAEAMPSEVNWNSWCGPAPMLAYNHRLAPSRNDVDFWPDWRLYEEVGGGILCDWGAHMFDIVQWALDMDSSGPVKYIPPTDRNAVRGLKMYYENGIEMIHEDFGRGWGVRFIGSEGTMDVSRSYLETTPENLLTADLSNAKVKLYNSKGNHLQDWVNATKTRTQPICGVETGHRSATVCNIANIAYNLGRPLEWDPKKEKFMGDSDANKMRGRKERKF